MLSCQGIAPSNPVYLPGRRIWCVPWYVVSEALGRCLCRGPFLSNAEIEEIVAWIDAGMPEGPPEDT